MQHVKHGSKKKWNNNKKRKIQKKAYAKHWKKLKGLSGTSTEHKNINKKIKKLK